MSKSLAALFAGITMFAASAATGAIIPDRVLQAAQDRVTNGEYPALVIAAVDHGKTEIEAYGKVDNGRLPDADTVFEIGSITKTFTATLLADAVLSNRVTLDEPLSKLLPDFAIPSRYNKQITLADLADQHSGLPRLPDNISPADPTNPYADYGPGKLKEFLAGYTLPRDPGSSYEYSNLGFGLLGYALASSAHTDYESLVREKILAPLGMKNSGVTLTPALRAHLVLGRDAGGDPVKNWDFDALAGCGAIRSTAGDMLRYLKANMGIDKTPLAAAMTLAHTPRADSLPKMRIGLAWMTTDSGIVWHNGATAGYRSFIGFTADGTRGVVILTNIFNSVDDLGFAVLDSSTPLANSAKAIVVSDADLDQYEGNYKLAENFNIHIFRNAHQLYGQATGQSPFPLFPSATNEFFARVGAITISFVRDSKGAVSSLVLHQHGDRPAPRMPDQPALTLDPALLGDYVGKYTLAPGAVFDVTLKEGQVFVQLGGQAAFPVFASAKDKFFYKVIDAQIDFERDAGGKVAALVLHQNGRDQRAPRTVP